MFNLMKQMHREKPGREKITKRLKFVFFYALCVMFSFYCTPFLSYAVAQVTVKNKQYATTKDAINIKDSGARGDGITDDTETLKKALTSLTSKNRKVFFPVGIYKVTETIFLPSNIQLEGTGNGSRLIMGKSLQKGIFSAIDQRNISVSGLSFEGTNIEQNKTDTERLIFFEKCSAVSIDDCDLSKTTIAIQGQGCIDMSVTNCHIHDITHREDFSQGYGMLFNLSCSNVTVDLNRFKNIGRHAVYVSSGTSNVIIRENVVDGCESYAIGAYSKSTQKVTENIEISGNDIRNVRGHVSPRGISIAVWCQGVTVRMNKLNNIQQYGIAVEGGALEEMGHNPSNIVIEGNTIGDCHSAGIWVVNASSIKVQKNIIIAVSGIVAATTGKLQGSYLKKFSALNNEITYEKYGITVGGGARAI